MATELSNVLDMAEGMAERLQEHLERLRAASGDHWRGRLCDSALATAIALVAWQRVAPADFAENIRGGVAFVVKDQHSDGGWGDSPESPSNLTASLLCWCALRFCHSDADVAAGVAVEAAERYLVGCLGGVAPADIRAGVLARYGQDRTFAAPILMLCALTGCLGSTGWRDVPRLPFELALLPRGLFRWMNLTVVSYALPALIAIGLVRRAHRPSSLGLIRLAYDFLEQPLLSIALRMQPANGGYEEAAPLTAFVAMSLAEAGHAEHPIVARGVRFLQTSQRANGALPIDTDLAHWVTLLAVQALTSGPSDACPLPASRRRQIADWLLANQHDRMHPLSFGAPGGWPWSDLPGAMPDADDTAGTLLSLRRLGVREGIDEAVQAGILWLVRLQNHDGGIPTFARGWGKLPFDRSCADITAHALQAFAAWLDDVPPALGRRMRRCMQAMVRYLERTERATGGWSPLWFGSQTHPQESNVTHGTARVVLSLAAASPHSGLVAAGPLAARGARWLVAAQRPDGGWGAMPGLDPVIEETALAIAALAAMDEVQAVARGLLALVRMTDSGRCLPAAPIGLYFDRLWYAEELYPVTFSLMAVRSAQDLLHRCVSGGAAGCAGHS